MKEEELQSNTSKKKVGQNYYKFVLDFWRLALLLISKSVQINFDN